MFQNIFITNKTRDEESTVYVWDDELGLRSFPYSDFDYAYKLDRNGDKTTIYGDRVSKTYRWNRGQPGIFESDVPRETRVLTDLYLDSDDIAKNHRVLTFDLEVERTANGFADVKRADGRISSIACHADTLNEYCVFLLDENEDIKHPMTNGNETVIPFKTEAELLKAFMEYYTTFSPTILTGWNTSGYDIPYLYHRLTNVFDKDTANMLSPIGMVKYNKNREQYVIAGVSCLDYLVMYKKFTFTKRTNYQLNTIGLIEVGMGKVEYEGTLDDFRKNDPKGFVEYNLQDVRIVVELDKNKRFIDLVKSISHAGHTQYEDCFYSSKYIEGTILTYLHRQNRIAPDKSPTAREEMDDRIESNEEAFDGAFVKPPMPGLYDWVFNLDLQSLYPSIIMSLNISPETKIAKVVGWDPIEYAAGKLGDVTVVFEDIEKTMSGKEFGEFILDSKFMVSSNGVIYRSDKLGVIPEILNVWFDQRLEFKNLMQKFKKEGNDEMTLYYKNRQHVQKILLNSIYGVLGLPIFRFYDLDNAAAVTSTGQDVIKMSSKFISNEFTKRGAVPKGQLWLDKYNEILEEELKKPKNRLTKDDVALLLKPDDHCIYIDTDSVYFTAMDIAPKNIDMAEYTINLGNEIEEAINKFYDTMAMRLFFCEKHRLVMKSEAVCETAFWVGKKRYGMRKVYDFESKQRHDPKLEFKGLDVVRSSFAKEFQRIMATCLDEILKKSPKQTLDELILDFRTRMNTMTFMQIAKNTSVRDLSDFDIKKERGYVKFVKSASASVKAALVYNRWLRNTGLDKEYATIKDGDNIKFAYMKDNEYNIDACALKGYDDPPELVEFVEANIDHKQLYDRELKNKLQAFYDALGWGLLPTEINQKTSMFFDF